MMLQTDPSTGSGARIDADSPDLLRDLLTVAGD